VVGRLPSNDVFEVDGRELRRLMSIIIFCRGLDFIRNEDVDRLGVGSAAEDFCNADDLLKLSPSCKAGTTFLVCGGDAEGDWKFPLTF
tara:strand:+ start:251 stop:514 length:264 start_codon:yes stop_codon:yes gene_type:complete